MMGTVYLTGIDTLAVGFNVVEFDLTEDEWSYLEMAKASAQGKMFDSGGTAVILRGHRFSMSPKGSHGYEYVLVNDDITVQLAGRATGGSSYPEVRVTWRSAYLWRYSWQAAFHYVDKWVREWALGDSHMVSRVDLCADMGMALPNVNVRGGEVVSYARNKREYHIESFVKGVKDTGYRIGQGDLMARVYDKVVEIESSDKTWFHEMWRKNGWDGESPVTRVEFQVRRGHLKDHQIETVQDLENQMGDLWRYFSIDWLSLRDSNDGDSNRRRWPVKNFWMVVQSCVSAFGVVTGVRRLTQREPKIAAVSRLARGVLVTMVALYRSTYESTPGTKISVPAAIGWLQEMTIKGWVSDPAFIDDVNSRAARLAAFS